MKTTKKLNPPKDKKKVNNGKRQNKKEEI